MADDRQWKLLYRTLSNAANIRSCFQIAANFEGSSSKKSRVVSEDSERQYRHRNRYP
jgi:hypothetical protein